VQNSTENIGKFLFYTIIFLWSYRVKKKNITSSVYDCTVEDV